MNLSADRISDLLIPFLGNHALDTTQVEGLRIYLDLLLRWNSKMNLTAVRDPEQIVLRHFGESLFAARNLFPDLVSASVIDIGSGAGFPGVPIKIWNDQAELTLIESNQRKATFLRELVRSLELKQVSIQSDRAETVATTADLVTLRAVERFDQILPTARQLMREDGRMALLIGAGQIQPAMTKLSTLAWQEALEIPLSQNRVLLVGNS